MADLLTMAYGLAALLLAVAAFHDAPVRWLRARREGRVVEDPVYHAVNAVSILVVVAWLAVLLVGLDRSVMGPLAGEGGLRVLGTGVGLLGFSLAAWARVAMAGAFAPTLARPPADRLIVQGPFAHLRHPFYAGLMLALAGGVLVLDSLATLVCLLVVLPMVASLARREETMLAETIGEPYETYRQRVPRWLPRPGFEQ